MRVKSYAAGKWHEGNGEAVRLYSAVTGEQVAEQSAGGLDYHAMLDYARSTGGPKLREMTIHERGLMVKSLAQYLNERKKEFYKLSVDTGATRSDSWIDIDGGISTLFVMASKSRREMNNDPFYVDGDMEQLSREGSFVGQHIYVPLEGAAIHINAFNFPCWGMLEKLGPTLIAGVPAIIKPSPVGSYLTGKMVEAIIESGILPEGAIQFIAADKPGDLLDHLDSQDVVAFTGSAETGQKLKAHPNIIRNSVRFNLESDSLNCSILGEDVTPDSEEFKLFVKEVYNEITSKTGQKCTAIRRSLVPRHLTDQVIQALKQRLDNVQVGDPNDKNVRMGPLASRDQLERFKEQLKKLSEHTEPVYGDAKAPDAHVQANGKGAYCSPVVLYCKNPEQTDAPHEIEAFGPMTTIMPYDSIDQAIEIAKRGGGSLVGSLFTADDDLARRVVLGVAPYHGRFMIINRESAGESTGHGSPLPHLTHGGPGRAGGGEELGGVRGILHYMQRVALQGSPTTLSAICNRYLKGARTRGDRIHPFQKYFDELQVGERLTTHRRTVTEADIVNFGCLSGDHFYAHMDDIGARGSLFEQRVAHGYFVLSAAAGLFVSPAPGPVLANYGLESLRFLQPVYIGDTIQVHLTVKSKTWREKRQPDETPKGIVNWDVQVVNQNDEVVADYEILTLVQRYDEE